MYRMCVGDVGRFVYKIRAATTQTAHLSHVCRGFVPLVLTEESRGYDALTRSTTLLAPATTTQDAGGTMVLTDVYCLYNRARGNQVCLLSPLPSLRALALFGCPIQTQNTRTHTTMLN